MRVAVIGAGAIGAVLADAATRAGHSVDVAVRTPIDSLILERGGVEHPVPARFFPEPADLASTATEGPPAVVFVTVKVTDNPSVAGWLDAFCRRPGETLVVAAQNGLDHEQRLRPYAPAGTRIVAGLAYVGTERLSAGRVRHNLGRRLVVPAAVAPLVTEILGPAIDVEGADDIETASWQKLLGNLVANPITALTLRRTDVFEDTGIVELARGVLEEAATVGRASGADITGTDVERTLAALTSYGHATGSSMLYDRLAGRPTEHDHLTGEVVRRGRALGIPTPLNAALLALLRVVAPLPA